MPLMLVSRSERNPICLVSLDPIFYSSYRSLYTITDKNEQMNEILRSFKEENIIKEEDVKDISNEKEPKKRFEKFEKLILGTGQEGFKRYVKKLQNLQLYCKS